jgi:putative DNA primase/helicase
MNDRSLFEPDDAGPVVGTDPPNTIDIFNEEARAWRKRANELIEYVFKYLVNRTDIYGRYGQRGPFTAKDGLTREKIDWHFRPVTPSNILGLHSTLAEEIEGSDGQPIVNCTCRWIAVDIDHHGTGPAPPENVKAAKHWHAKAASLGFRPLTYQSNGRGGYRLLIVFSEPIQAAHAFAFVRWLISDWKSLGLAQAPEFFPKQKKICVLDDPYDAKGACGNWLRLFGRHHKREHHSRFWTGSEVVVGDAAIDWVLDHRGDDPQLIPSECLRPESGPSVGMVREQPKTDQPKTFEDLALATSALRSLTLMAADYDPWLKVGMALHELGDPGLSLWDSWSKSCEEKYQAEVCAEKWQTFDTAAELNGEGVTLGTIFDLAKQAGWTFPKTVWKSSTTTASAPSGQAGASTPPTDWPAEPRPIRHELPPVPSLEPGMVPAPLRPWLADIAERVGCALEFVVVCAMVALGIVIGRKVAIKPRRRDDWTVVPNLWGAIVGDPGVLKTPALAQAIRPLRRLEAEARKAHALALEQFKIDRNIAQAQSEAAKAALKSAAKDNKPAAVLETLARNAASVETPDEPAPRRYSTSDATVEKLGELLAANPNIGIVRDELTGWLRTLEKPEQGSARSFYLEAYEGLSDNFQYDRIGRGHILIPHVTVSVLGGIQPGPMRAFLRLVAEHGKADDGLISRFSLAVWPDKTKWRNIDRWPETTAKNRAFEVFKRLDSLDPVKAGAMPEPEGGPPSFRFLSPAQDVCDTWREALENEKLRSPDESPLIESHLAKYRKLMPALALLFHLAEIVDGQASGLVSLASAELAVKWCDFLEAHARRIYSCVMDADTEPARALSERIKAGALPSPFQTRDIYRRGWSGLDDPHAARRAVGILQDLGWLRIVDIPQTGGAPREDIHIHPKLPRKPPENQKSP